MRLASSLSRSDGFLCGWRVRSELTLPELAAWSGDERPPDIVIRIGPIPDQLDNLVGGGASLQVDQWGNCLVRIDGVAGYFVKSRGDEVIISPEAHATEVEIRVFLLGSVLGLLCHQRKLFPLHASCVAFRGKAVALCGQTGAGKSTAAVQLIRRGHQVVADDVCVVDAHAAQGPRVLPAFPRLKLSPAALAAVQIPCDRLEQDQLGQQTNFHYIQSQGFSVASLPLGGIFLLQTAGVGAPEECIQILRPVEKIALLGEHVFRAQAGFALGRTRSLFAAQAAIAGSTPIWRLARRFDFSEIEPRLGQVEALSES